MKQMLEICKITSVVGLKGEVKVQPWCDDPQLLCELTTLYRKSGDPVTVERARVQKNMAVLKLKGTDTVEEAQKLQYGIRVGFKNTNSVVNMLFDTEAESKKYYDQLGSMLETVNLN